MVTVTVELGRLTPEDVRVEVVHGPVGRDGEFLLGEHPAAVELTRASNGDYTGKIVVGHAGSYGVSARVIPVHPDLAHPFDLGRMAWAT